MINKIPFSIDDNNCLIMHANLHYQSVLWVHADWSDCNC